MLTVVCSANDQILQDFVEFAASFVSTFIEPFQGTKDAALIYSELLDTPENVTRIVLLQMQFQNYLWHAVVSTVNWVNCQKDAHKIKNNLFAADITQLI